MKILVLITSVVLSVSALAQDRVLKMSESHEFLDDHISLFLDNGEIVHINSELSSKLEIIEDAIVNQTPLNLTRSKVIGENVANILLDVSVANIDYNDNVFGKNNKEMYSEDRFNMIKFSTLDPLENGRITNLRSYESASAVMNSMNPKTAQRSQCYNRAHMWSYEALLYKKVNLGKIWIFFTKKYIREYKYKWWFHVAPFTQVGNEEVKYVLDRGFTKIPYTVENWKNIYMQNKATCPVVTDYQDYEKHPNAQYCYLMFSSQYYWQPWQLEKLSKEGQHFWGYKKSELYTTYKNALGGIFRRVKVPEFPSN